MRPRSSKTNRNTPLTAGSGPVAGDFNSIRPSSRGAMSSAAGGVPGCFRMQLPDGGRVRSLLRPFYTVEEAFPYKIYFDTRTLQIKYW